MASAILASLAVRPLDHAFPLTILHGIATAVFAFDAEDKTRAICAIVKAVANCSAHKRNRFLIQSLVRNTQTGRYRSGLCIDEGVREHPNQYEHKRTIKSIE
jgi:hypothetical protein